MHFPHVNLSVNLKKTFKMKLVYFKIFELIYCISISCNSIFVKVLLEKLPLKVENDWGEPTSKFLDFVLESYPVDNQRDERNLYFGLRWKYGFFHVSE